jgi:hypothetical protein
MDARSKNVDYFNIKYNFIYWKFNLETVPFGYLAATPKLFYILKEL